MAKVATTEFTSHKTNIPGLIFFDVTSVGDDRGWFQEKFHKDKLVEGGIPEDFQVVQNSLSYNKQKGVVRGLHAEPWDKYISVVKGKVFAAYVDLREGSNFGKVETIEITPNIAVFLPEGVANSFQTLEDETYYLYSVNKHWTADDYDKYMFVNLGDPDLNIQWPIALEDSVMSDRDKNHPQLKDIIPMKVGN
ncbi:MAG TPA: dTDP-4-dehydrorhamnose 3,5-epimerase family protein [Candidatus Saccharibacteria bacterium]|nr:dTDP-4-dehydrorhamnose 3,5-epimerase family protein [Candidatus Saccharibacteria bacterium]